MRARVLSMSQRLGPIAIAALVSCEAKAPVGLPVAASDAGNVRSAPSNTLIAVVMDVSTSRSGSIATLCGEFSRRISDVLAARQNRRGLIVYGVATGNATSPQVFANFEAFQAPTVRGQTSDPFADRAQARASRQQANADGLRRSIAVLVHRCESLQPSESPVFAVLDATIEAVSAYCAKREHACSDASVQLQSDLRDPSVLLPIAKKRAAALVPKLASIEFEACGSRQVRARVSLSQALNYEAAWRRLFPGLTISPTCLSAASSGTGAEGTLGGSAS